MSEEIKEKLDLFPDNMNDIAKEAYYQLENYITNLQQKVEQLENENFNIRENIHLERISLPPELTKDKDFMGLYDIPSYEDLQQLEYKVEQLEKEINRLNNIINGLEKYCNEEIIDYDKAIDSKILSEIDRDRYEAEKVCFLDMLDKLKELKEDK